jgi:hypothetical protein
MRSRNRRFNESYSDINVTNVWDAYYIAKDYLGADTLCDNLAQSMDTLTLSDQLKDIFRLFEIPFMDDEELDESFSRKYSRKIKESLNDIIEGKYGEYHIDAPSGNIESWTVWFIPYENRSAPIHDRWDSGTFIPDGSERIQYRCQRRIDAERIIDRWERKV